MNRGGGTLAVAHCQNHGGGAAHDVAAREDARLACAAGLFVRDDIAPFIDLQIRRRLRQKRVRARADGDDDRIHLQREFRAFDGNRAAAAGFVRFAKLHAQAFHADDMPLLIPQNARRIGQQMELNPLFFRVFHFFETGGHLGFRAPVNQIGMLRAEPQRGAHGIHCHVAAAEYRHVFPLRNRRVVIREIVGFHQIRARQIFVRGIDAVQVFARNPHEFGQPRAVRNINGVKAFGRQFINRVGSADHDVRFNRDAQFFEIRDFGFDNLFRQAELRDAIH